MKTDGQILRDVLDEIRWDPRLAATAIGIHVQDAVVTLTGVVDAYARKIAAQQAAHRVWGVHDVANDLEVVAPENGRPRDADIEIAARQALQWNALLPDEGIRSTVSNGWVTLSGEVDRCVQRDDAATAVRGLAGVTGVTNNITVRRPPPGALEPSRLHEMIARALERRADRRAANLTVIVRDGMVTVTGRVGSHPEREAIRTAIACAPGVRCVHDRLVVRAEW